MPLTSQTVSVTLPLILALSVILETIMLPHSKAFVTYRDLSQAHIDFVVVVCHAVPALKADIALSKATLTNKPDHFKADRNPKGWIASRAGTYQDKLARSTLITVFSYFESYVKDALLEVVEFHGGKEKFRSLARQRSGRFVSNLSATLLANKRKLQDNFEPVKIAKYQKFGHLLDKSGFRFPTDLLSNYGARYLIEKLDEKRGMRAWEIPSLLEDCILMSVEERDRKLFEDVRKIRNKIAHGKPIKLLLPKALSFSSELHTFAANIDKHLVEHFFVIQVV
jgi:hypothetical protein